MTTKTDAQFPPEAPLDCPLCPRLVAYRGENARAEPDWFNAPVPSFGSPDAELLVIGLAPGRTGANRTGRPFTGDWAGDLLYPTLSKFGFSEGEYQARPDDGLRLKSAMITNAVRCVPPENKPVGAEINACRPFLNARLEALPKLKVMITLGKISHDSTIRTLGLKLKDYPFGHAVQYECVSPWHDQPLQLISSYHCSRYNTNTGRLTEDMFHDVFRKAQSLI
ncbi:MAG: uracil-DNA glycosylase [Ponticaulis sp.]|nr:uracil-DNA glycosylase [Ponticaulis sp.]|tara:strand:- start:2638 stop:3306 length:669 start_codon:yes stop_codon:yes gene_type:complete